MTMSPDRPTTVLIGALGGEGGGVLSKWLVDVAETAGMWVQATSVPGVAQRTGATTYYLELYPKDEAADGSAAGRRPVMALTPTPGNVDIVITSELLEAGRAVQNGFVTPDRTTLITSTHRVFAVVEKSAMGDGRFNVRRIEQAAGEMARRTVLFDMGRLARKTGSVISAVLFGAIAGSGALALSRGRFEDAIRRGGIAVEANLAGFAAGFAAARERRPARQEAAAAAPAADGLALPDRLARRVDAFPAPAQRTVHLGVVRMLDYQDAVYAGAYLTRLEAALAADRNADGEARGFALTDAVARQLALRMSFEDMIRVAELKTRRSRFARVRAEVGAKENEPLRISEFMKPGIEEWASIMPPLVGRVVMGYAERHALLQRYKLTMRVKTSTVRGFLPLWLLAKQRWWRPRTFRYAGEQAMIDGWLSDVTGTAAGGNYDLALEVTALAQLIKGYGDTHRRGVGNYARIVAALPALAGRGDAAMRLKGLREAALANPEGAHLSVALAALHRDVPEPIAAE